MEGQASEVTALLRAWRAGDEQARDRLMPLVYDALYRRAAAYLGRERRDHTLQPTALVNEVYLRLVDQRRIDWQNRAVLRCRRRDDAPYPRRPRAGPTHGEAPGPLGAGLAA